MIAINHRQCASGRRASEEEEPHWRGELSEAAAGATDRYLVAALCLLSAIPAVAINLYLPALPVIGEDLDSPISSVQHTLAVFLIGVAVGQLIYGPLSDRIGRRGPLLAGLAIYTAASAACAFASDLTALIAFRLLQALGGCAAAVLGRAIVGDRFGRQEAARIFALLLVVMSAAPVLAPLIGGWLTTVLGWRAVFWVLAAMGLASTVAALFLLPESRQRSGAGLAAQETPHRAYWAALKNRHVLAYGLAFGLTAAGMLSILTAAPEVIIGVYKVSPAQFGWMFGLNSLGLALGAQVARLLLRRLSVDALLRLATATGAAAAALLAAMSVAGWGGLPGLLVLLFVIFTACGASGPSAMAAAMSADPQRTGSVSALLGSGQFALGASAAAAVAAAPGAQQPMALIAGFCFIAGWGALKLRPVD